MYAIVTFFICFRVAYMLKKCYNIPKIQRSEDFTQLYTNAKGTYLVVATHYRALFVSAKIKVI